MGLLFDLIIALVFSELESGSRWRDIFGGLLVISLILCAAFLYAYGVWQMKMSLFGH